jgi:fructose transport system permease protein
VNGPKLPETVLRTRASDTATQPTGEAPVAPSFAHEHISPLRRFRIFIHNHATFVPFLILVLSVLAFSIDIGAKFFSPFNISLILQQVTVIATVGLAQTLVILTAGIDLSVGAILVIAHIVMARFAVSYGIPAELALAAGEIVAIACGAINGCLVTMNRLPPFIATLGTWSIFGALITYYSNGETIAAEDIEVKAPLLQFLGRSIKVMGGNITYGFVALLVVSTALWYFLNWTAMGRYVYATGDSDESARLAGIDTKRVLISVYTVSGAICGIGSWMLIGRIGAASPLAGGTLNIDSITAVVIGGTSLFGGRGSIVGTLLGALIVGVFRNGLSLANFDVLWQEFAVGFLILIAVTIDQWIRKVAN